MKNSDPTAELREKIVSLTLSCPKGLNVDDCPFRLLNELCSGTKNDTLGRMNHDALLKLFDFSINCSCPADPRKAAGAFQNAGAEI
jgi:hypothetical protein